MEDLILLSDPEPAAQDQLLMTFAASMGVSMEIVSIQDGKGVHASPP